ncbi:MAG: hypothetical protein NZ750_08155 [Anaerolineae bacterium]|nr:hypothetical protein [Anaerolineae bacterium]MDW8172322.1 hypothetical protein [Anaerolineae bacterium]
MNGHLLEVAEVLKESEVFRLSWFDAEKTIIVTEILKPWTWEDAFDVVPLLNRMVEQQPHDVYTTYYYHIRSIALLPKGGMANLRRLLEIDPPNEKLVIFVRQDNLTRQLMSVVSKVYGLNKIMGKYRFVTSWQEAMAQIEAHKAQAT